MENKFDGINNIILAVISLPFLPLILIVYINIILPYRVIRWLFSGN